MATAARSLLTAVLRVRQRAASCPADPTTSCQDKEHNCSGAWGRSSMGAAAHDSSTLPACAPAGLKLSQALSGAVIKWCVCGGGAGMSQGHARSCCTSCWLCFLAHGLDQLLMPCCAQGAPVHIHTLDYEGVQHCGERRVHACAHAWRTRGASAKQQRVRMPAPCPASPWLRCTVPPVRHLHRTPWRWRVMWRLRQQLHGKASWPSHHLHQPTSVRLRTRPGTRSMGLAQVLLQRHFLHKTLCDPHNAQHKRTESATHGEALSAPRCSAYLCCQQLTCTCFLCLAGRPGLEPSQPDQLSHVWHSSAVAGYRCASSR